jgi:hypothetical protein
MMSGFDEELRRYLENLSAKLVRDMSAFVADEADDLRAAIAANIPADAPSELADSVHVRRGRQDHTLDVTVGGNEEENHAALAAEYGIERNAGQSYFHATVDDWADGYARRAEQALAEALSEHE